MVRGVSGEKWGVFDCPECDEELTIVDVNVVSGEVELECVNGHAWIIGPADRE